MEVTISREVKKTLVKLPVHIVAKLKYWIDLVENEGIDQARKTKGFHDEPLLGRLRNKRSIRLSRKWRAIYSQNERTNNYQIITIKGNSP